MRSTSNRGTRRPFVDQSWGPTIYRTIKRCNLRPIVRSIVAPDDRSYHQSWHDDRSYHQSWHPATDRPSNRAIADPRSSTTGGATMNNWLCDHGRLICDRWLEVLNMNIDLAATDFALPITHDLCDQSCVLCTSCPRFQHFSVAARS